MKFDRYIDIARGMKKTHQEIRQFHVAFIIKNNRPIVIGTNKNKTHPAIRKYAYRPEQKLHAELNTVLCGGRNTYTGYDFLVIRIDNNGNLNNSRPCKGCASLLDNLGFRTISYSNGRGAIETHPTIR